MHGQIRYELKTPYSNGTTHVIFQPLDFIAKLAKRFRKTYKTFVFDGIFTPPAKAEWPPQPELD